MCGREVHSKAGPCQACRQVALITAMIPEYKCLHGTAKICGKHNKKVYYYDKVELDIFTGCGYCKWKAFLTTKNCEEYGLVWSDEVGLGMPGCCREIGNHHRRALMEYFKYEDVHIRIARSSLPSNTPTLTPS